MAPRIVAILMTIMSSNRLKPLLDIRSRGAPERDLVCRIELRVNNADITKVLYIIHDRVDRLDHRDRKEPH